MSATQASPSSAIDGFFSTLGQGLGIGLSRIGSDVLPRFVDHELNSQQYPQLFNPLFDPRAAPRPVAQKAFLDINKPFLQIDATTILLTIVAIGAIYFVVK